MTLVAEVLQHFAGFEHPQQVVHLGGGGGFSGAELRRVTMAGGSYCLRRWPRPHPSLERLHYIHALVRRVHQAGLPLPLPLTTKSGETFVSWRKHYWELAPWMPGAAVSSPTTEQVEAAMHVLAEFHLAAAGPADPIQPSPGLSNRRNELHRLLKQSSELERAIDQCDWPEFRVAGNELLRVLPCHAPQIDADLAECQPQAAPLQSCLRDIWSEHVLFRGEQVTGLIDFGAAAVETVAGDVVRLLGSMAGSDRERRARGLSAYQSIRPLTALERRMMPVFERSGLLLGAAAWFRWILLENRQFEQHEVIVRRIQDALDRLRKIAPAE